MTSTDAKNAHQRMISNDNEDQRDVTTEMNSQDIKATTNVASSWASSLVTDYVPKSREHDGARELERKVNGHDHYDNMDNKGNDGGEEKDDDDEEKKMEINTAQSKFADDLSSPNSSPFRKSLEEEHRAKQTQLTNPKQLLRQSLASLSNAIDPQGQPALTRPERNFLESLLAFNGPGAYEACMAAHSILMDGNLFFGTMCAGSAGEVAERVPGHRWTTLGSSLGDSNVGCYDDDQHVAAKDEKGARGSERNNDELIQPDELPRKVASEARQSRLMLRKHQPPTGTDVNRLFRAHEAGIVVTPGGSARRSLMRMGLPMEKGLVPPAMCTTNPSKDPKMVIPNFPSSTATVEGDGSSKEIDEKTTFEKTLAKIDERTIRRIEKEERAKQKNELILRPQTPKGGGCISPLSMNVLRTMFASKQFSFHHSSSSYSRYDSFLNTATTSDTGFMSDSTSGGDDCNKNDIFRPSPRANTAEDRLKNLLINAGFKDEFDGDNSKVFVTDAATEDDAEIMRGTSTDSVALLMEGGPSFRDVNMFRETLHPEDRQPRELLDVGELPTISDLGELPNKPPSSSPESDLRKRSNTIGIIKPSSFRTLSPSRKGKYSRSVSWGHMVLDKEGGKATGDHQASSSSILNDGGMSIISFPNLRRAVPLRSDSLGSSLSAAATSLPPLRLGAPLRSDSTMSLSSILSPFPLSRANPVFSPMASFASLPPPALSLATAVRSESQMTIGSNIDDDRSLNSADYIDVKPNLPKGAAWEHPTQRCKITSNEISVFIRQASTNNYEGMGIEIEHSPLETIDSARKYRSLLSNGDHSTRSSTGRRSSLSQRLPMKHLDDSFIIKNINFERHSSEILRSLSNEDLHSSHHLETINGDSSRCSKVNDHSSVARVNGDQLNESWDLESSNSAAIDAWGVLEDEYAEGYGALNTLPFRILGTSANDTACHPHVLSPPLMESLQNFLPPTISENNFWLKYSLVRDGASLPSLLRNIRGTRRTIIAIETVEGEVFGTFTSSPWRKNWNYFGNGESFLWRMRRSRSEKDAQHSILDQAKLESELEVFYWSGRNNLVQYCTHDMLAVGGGSLMDDNRDDLPDEQLDMGGFGLAIDSDLLRGTSSPCATFQSPPLSKIHSNGGPFEILNMEVWTLTPCGSVGEAENIEMTALFLETYNREH